MSSVKAPYRDDEVHTPVLLGLLFRRLGEAMHATDWGGLRQSHFRLLAALPPQGLSVTELAERLQVTKQGCGQLVAPLVESGHLRVEPSPRDGRVRVVRRTPKGGRLYASVRRRIAAIEGEWAQEVGEERYADFVDVLRTLALGQPTSER